jgi:DNA-binding HxlR family transcriptional regulator
MKWGTAVADSVTPCCVGATERTPGPDPCDPTSDSCPVEAAIRVMNGKWKPLILWHLYFEGTKRFGELRRGVPQATEKMLIQHLRELESDGLVTRTVYPQVPPKVEYALTDRGRRFGPVLLAMYDWGVSLADEAALESSSGA